NIVNGVDINDYLKYFDKYKNNEYYFLIIIFMLDWGNGEANLAICNYIENQMRNFYEYIYHKFEPNFSFEDLYDPIGPCPFLAYHMKYFSHPILKDFVKQETLCNEGICIDLFFDLINLKNHNSLECKLYSLENIDRLKNEFNS